MGVTIVTGASSGIGRSAAVEVARRGAGVILTYRRNPEGARETVRDIEAMGGSAVALPLDLADHDTFPGFRAEIERELEERWGTRTIHALVNNGGFGGGVPFPDMDAAALDGYYAVHFKGPYLLTRELAPIIEDGGVIVSTSSSSVRPGDTTPGYSAYAGMKAALVVATRYLALELSPRGIRVNSIAPGPTRTRLGDDGFERFPELVDELAARTALGRIGEPEDIGRVIAFLVSDDARWITGQDLLVAGGWAL